MKKTFKFISTLTLVIPLMIGAEELEEQPLDPIAKQRLLEKNVYAQTRGNNGFALELYSRLRSQPGNIFFSPYSISSALVFPFAGAQGVTQAEMQNVLHYQVQGEGLYETFSWLNQHFSSPFYQGPNETRLFIANSLWIQRDIRVLPAFTTIASTYFKAALKQTDFARNPGSSILNINSWVRERTQGRIPELVSSQDIDKSTRLVVVSSIFMKAVWKTPFDPSLTKQASFFVDKYTTVSAQMMSNSQELPIFISDSFSVLEIPYRSNTNAKDTQLSMLIFLPKDTQGLNDVEKMLTAEHLEAIFKQLQRETVILSLPKFKIGDEISLNTTLQKMGMNAAFSDVANFSGITGENDLVINNVLHKAYLAVDEKGSEAVAATAVTMGLKSVAHPRPAKVFNADHPFLFLIVDRSINAILFMGRLLNPEEHLSSRG